MDRPTAPKAMLGGFVATLVMTGIMAMTPVMGMPKMDVAAMLGSMIGGGAMPAPMSGLWWAGMIFHFINGTFIFPLAYAFLLYDRLAGAPWLRGIEWD